MVEEINPDRLPPDQKKAFDGWLDSFKEAFSSKPFYPYLFDREDKNLTAFGSKEAFISWYGQPPGNEPYRDDGFYPRELTWLSMWCRPKKIVEFGTDKGIGSLMLSRLNPDAIIHTIDIMQEVPMPGDGHVETGFFARSCENVHFCTGNSKNFEMDGVDLCFIDGDHSADGVWGDSVRAWMNRSAGERWAIIWHDYRNHHDMAGLKAAIWRFSNLVRKKVYKFADSSTVFMTSGD